MTIGVYYHVWSPIGTDVWRLLVDEQLKRLYMSGLPSQAIVNCLVNGPQSIEIAEFIKVYDWAVVKVVGCHGEDSTLKLIHSESLLGKYEKVLYFHTKGITHFAEGQSEKTNKKLKAVNSWRHAMEHFCIDEWEANVVALDSHQVSGVNYQAEPWPHFSGNFWWARSDYLCKLSDPTCFSSRIDSEKWVCSMNPTFKDFYPFPLTGVQDEPEEPSSFWPYRDDVLPHLIENKRKC
jgi:hypothetical protein